MNYQEIPFDILKKNKSPKIWDDYILEKYKCTNRFSDIKEGHKLLDELTIVHAYKEIAKTLYASGIEPNLIHQFHEYSTVIGSTGEALIELLIPDKELPVNNDGFDINFKGNYIEIKSTLVDKVSMSSSQYNTSDYLLIIKFHKGNGKFNCAWLAPMLIVKAYKNTRKPDSKQLATVNTERSTWVRGLKITLPRIRRFFINQDKILSTFKPCKKCYSTIVQSDNSINFRAMTEPCNTCAWEERYIYFTKGTPYSEVKENLFINKRQQTRKKIQQPHIRPSFLLSELNGQIFIDRSCLIRAIFNKDRIGLYFGRHSVVKTTGCTKGTVVYPFNELYDYMLEFLNINEQINEFHILYKSNGKIDFLVRTGMAPVKPGFIEESFLPEELPKPLRKALTLSQDVLYTLNDGTQKENNELYKKLMAITVAE
ncbi:hypothetical protein FM038_009625 [Shewanella eurypsychrophilus]|uniref:Restriction endonuclease n=1 Tax=Shewanella eurypsychrophilus TaxID=2593656 RepID=A0ABX6V4W4_9GAMM|nr:MULTISPECIES: hypothetical protein [Shewanella]QFU22386.1 hypothetical protein FS418_11205 [Shewanella sp. YLB-09]QPG57673.1 hypothetical protein FM038_009625 [Shewanella eurypsychrophilus]